MPRHPRNFLSTTFFHVITQGIDRRYIFDTSEDIKFYIALMNKLKQKYNVQIIAYCIMNNHTHKLVKIDKIENLSKFMQSLNTTYAKYYNSKYKRVGYVFRDRFKAEGIYSERQLYNCINYIYNNPVKAKICKNPEEYPYSNYKKIDVAYTGDKLVFIDIEEDREIDYEEIINDFLKDNKTTIEEIINNEILFKQLILILKENYNISFRKMSKIFNCNRDRIRNIYNK